MSSLESLDSQEHLSFPKGPFLPEMTSLESLLSCSDSNSALEPAWQLVAAVEAVVVAAAAAAAWGAAAAAWAAAAAAACQAGSSHLW